jgi:hypothetical protein
MDHIPWNNVSVAEAMLPYRLEDIQPILIHQAYVSEKSTRTRACALRTMVSLSVPQQRSIMEACELLPPAKRRKISVAQPANVSSCYVSFDSPDTVQESSFVMHTGRTAQSVFGHLTMQHLKALASPILQLTYQQKRSRAKLLEAFSNAPTNLQTLLMKAAEQMQGRQSASGSRQGPTASGGESVFRLVPEPNPVRLLSPPQRHN